eukprot:m.88170 g.88170  ORF g.88170 m.88170 type:complete len:100 (+) comp8353_c0_seq2:1829-2128(+)
MLRSLSGRSHEVITGVVLLFPNRPPVEFAETTSVEFAVLQDAEIDAYVATGEPMDKAGSYGIQSMGGLFVRGVRGDYYNVVGFPLHRFANALVGIYGQP